MRTVRRRLADGTIKAYHYPRASRVKKPARVPSDSVSALIAAYQRSPEWRALAPVTRQTYSIYLRDVGEFDHQVAAGIKRRDLLNVRDAIALKRGNGAATGFMRAASAVFRWAVEREWMEHNPALGSRALPSGHLPAWSEAVAQLAMRPGTLPEPLRRIVVLAYYTGQRRGDLCALPWKAYDGTMIRLTQGKTEVSLVIPVHPALKVELDAWKSDAKSLVMLTKEDGETPWRGNQVSHALPRALHAAGLDGVQGLNVHGLRKLAATRLAEAGCTVHEIAAITGHKSLNMVALYTASVDQERLAGAAIMRLVTGPEKAAAENAKRRGKSPKKTGA